MPISPEELSEMLRDRASFKKALLEADFTTNGADLNPEQAQEYIQLVRGESKFLDSQCRFETVTNLKGELPKMHFGYPITVGGAEVEDATNTGKPALDIVSYDCTKTKVRTDTSLDALMHAAGGKTSMESALLDGIKRRAAIDKELMAFEGDETTWSADTTPHGKLLKVQDGWALAADSGRVVDAAGAALTIDLLEAGLDMFSPESWTDAVKWIGNMGMWRDYRYAIRDEVGGIDVVSQFLFGEGKLAAGMLDAPFVPVSVIPNSRTVSIVAATPAQVKSELKGPFQITATSNKLDLDFEGSGSEVITLDTGLQYASDIAKKINENATFAGQSYAQDWEGYLLLSTNLTGVAQEIIIAAEANDAYTVLGLTAATYTGSDAGTAGDQHEGSYLLLCDPKNLVYVQSNEIRMTVKYDEDTDGMKIVIYEYVDMFIENTEALVKIKNIRKRR